MNALAFTGEFVNRISLKAVHVECLEPRIGRDSRPPEVRGSELGDNREVWVLAQDPRHPCEDGELGSLDVDLDDIYPHARRHDIIELNNIDFNPNRSPF